MYGDRAGNVLVHATGQIPLRQLAAVFIVHAPIRSDAFEVIGYEMLAFACSIPTRLVSERAFIKDGGTKSFDRRGALG